MKYKRQTGEVCLSRKGLAIPLARTIKFVKMNAISYIFSINHPSEQ